MSLEDQSHARRDLGMCSALAAESAGPAGQRFFRLRATAEHGTALLWIEKEELRELAHTIKRMLRTPVRPALPPRWHEQNSSSADFEFKIFSIALGHDAARDRYMLLAQASEDEDNAIVLWLDTGTIDRMADQAFDVHDAGRARCPLCGAATVDGKRHLCPRAN
jgi:uncharacterized repeat protein (TIGR03847 family)